MTRMGMIKVTGRQEERHATGSRRWAGAFFAAALALTALAGCDMERRSSDAELALNPPPAGGEARDWLPTLGWCSLCRSASSHRSRGLRHGAPQLGRRTRPQPSAGRRTQAL